MRVSWLVAMQKFVASSPIIRFWRPPREGPKIGGGVESGSPSPLASFAVVLTHECFRSGTERTKQMLPSGDGGVGALG